MADELAPMWEWLRLRQLYANGPELAEAGGRMVNNGYLRASDHGKEASATGDAARADRDGRKYLLPTLELED